MEQLLSLEGEAMGFVFVSIVFEIKIMCYIFLIVIVIHVDTLIMENTETVK